MQSRFKSLIIYFIVHCFNVDYEIIKQNEKTIDRKNI
jgi:hypothetical protein